MKLTDHTILITGGTSGIGRALAERLHQRGNRIIIAGRRQELLDQITAEHPGMSGICLDVGDPDAIDAFAARIQEEFPDLDWLVNNAGISRVEDLTAGTRDQSSARSIIQTNILAVLQLTTALLPALMRQPQSGIITTTSGLAFVPRADFPTYSASKAFLHSWLQSLRFQLRETSVEVLELAPPYVQTELGGPAQATDPHAMPLAEYIDEVLSLLERSDFPDGEILVERVKALRRAEQEGAFEERFTFLNQMVLP